MFNFKDKDWLAISIIFNLIFLFIMAFMCIGYAQNLESDAKEIYKLNQDKHSLDSIINVQHDYILQLTYQHEDDDALMEEEQP